jgi:uncharacterized protein YkvS
VRTISALAFIAALAAPAAAQTTTATHNTTTNTVQMADGTYTGVVEKVLDNKNILVKLSNGTEATLKTTRANVDFSKCQTNEPIKFSLVNGLVAVYAPANQ